MGMDWLKGLVGSSDQMVPAGQPVPSPYGVQQPQAPGAWGPPPGAQTPAGPQPGSPPPAWGQPMPTGQQPGAPPAWGAPPADAPVAQPSPAEADLARLRQDVDAIALFARTLLGLLEAKGVCNEQEFQEMKLKMDALDGKVDGKVG